jgi:hypothetical protein
LNTIGWTGGVVFLLSQSQLVQPSHHLASFAATVGLSPPEVRAQGEALVATIINSYQKLDGELEGIGVATLDPAATQRAREQLAATMSALDSLESYVMGVLFG